MPRPRAEAPKYSLTRRGARYYVQWWAEGSAQRVSTWTGDKRQAEEFLAQFIAARNAPVIPVSPTVLTILNGYIADRSEDVKHPENFVFMKKALEPILGGLLPEHLNRERIRYYTKARRTSREKKPLSNGTIIRELTTLRNALAWAVKAGWIDKSKVPDIAMPPAPAPRKRWLTKPEAARLIASAKEDHVRLFIALALYTAARMTAILELTWDQVDMEGGLIDLGAAQGNKRRAVVPIHPVLRPLLAKAHRTRLSDSVVEYRGDPVASVKKGVAAAARRAGLSGVTPHVFRHTAATWMVMSGVSFEEVATFLGNSIDMVERVYSHLAPGFLQRASDALT